MSKFKVGDKVRTMAKGEYGYDNSRYLGVGKEFVVDKVHEELSTISLVGQTSCWSEHRFELVKEEAIPVNRRLRSQRPLSALVRWMWL